MRRVSAESKTARSLNASRKPGSLVAGSQLPLRCTKALNHDCNSTERARCVCRKGRGGAGCPTKLAAPYLQKILVDGEAIGAVRQAVFGQIIFDMAAGWWPADGQKFEHKFC